MRASRQQHGAFDFTMINRIHVPVALGSMLALVALLAHAAWRRRHDDATLLGATVALAILGNALLCGALSGPHDRYGARMAWLATFAVLIVIAGAAERGGRSRTP
jgi:peptidoglycan/LPS O-acetylase OafA/YrhL